MNYSLPNNTVRPNGIKKIDFSNPHFIEVHRYGIDDDNDIIQYVPNKRGNREKITEMYYDEMKKYLDAYAPKYESYNYTKSKKKIDKKLISLLIIGSILMFGTSVPLLGTHEALGFLGITLDVVAIPTLIAGISLGIKKSSDDKKEKFIKEYNDMSDRLRIYSVDKSKVNEPTKYNGIDRVDDKTRVVDINKKRVKVNNNIKNAA